MMWPFTRKKRHLAEERAAILEKKKSYEQQLVEIRSQRPKVELIRDFLVTRHVHNGFGEDLSIAWTPRGR